ncbi:hypothetical protein X946_2582 [Burkholderia sp. ABCPW 111]|nr:hypothetical protein X946_2582 [Burkholderia sp. ABCPW 111]
MTAGRGGSSAALRRTGRERRRAGDALRAPPSRNHARDAVVGVLSFHAAYLSVSTQCASVPASALVNCVFAGIGTPPHTPTLPLTIVCAR